MSLLMRRRLLLSTTDNFQPAPPIHFMSADTAVLPFLSAASYPHAAYVASLDKTFITWERVPSPHESSVAAIMSYDHTAKSWSTVYDVGTWNFIDDAHGQPVIVHGPDGHFYCYFGSHNSTQYAAVSTNANDISKWNAPVTAGTPYTYPKPIAVGSDIHVFWRKGAAGVNKTLVHRKGTPVAGSMTLGAETTLIDFASPAASRVYAAEVHAVGTDIHIIATYQAETGGSPRLHVYYFIYDTTTGDISNVAGTTTVAAASMPINLTTANASFRIVEHTGSNVNVANATLNFDTTGNAHVVYGDGVPDGLNRVQTYHMFWNGSTWSTPVTIAMVEKSTAASLVPGKKGRMEVWYPQDDGDAHLYGGSTMCRRKWNGVNWSAQEVMATASGSYPLDRPFSIRDGHPDIRVAFCEMVTSFDYGAADNLKRYAHGDKGYVIGPDPAVLQYASDAGSDVLHVRVNDNSRIIDYTGNHFTPTNTTVSGTEMVFNGTSAYVSLVDSAAYTPSADWTLQFDGLKFASVAGIQALFVHGNYGVGGAKSWSLLFDNTGLYLYGDTGGGHGLIKSHLWTAVVGTSYDVAYERKGNTLYIYIDDFTAGNHVASVALSSAFVNVAQPFTIGAEYNTTIGGNYQRFFNGRMSKVRLVHSALYAA